MPPRLYPCNPTAAFVPAPIALLLVVLVTATPVLAQSDGYLQLNDEIHTFLERQHTLGNLSIAFLDEQPLSARRAHRYLDSLAADPEVLTPRDRDLLAQYRGTKPRPGASAVRALASPLYANGRDFFAIQSGPLRLQINPLLYLSAGTARETDVDGESRRPFIYRNTRAVRISGRLGRNFFFHSQLEENQRVEPMIARDRHRRRLPLAFQPDSSLFDYALSRAALGYQDRYVEIRLARDQQRWGFARGAMYYSNHAPPHTSLQARVEVWRLSFTAHYAILDDAARAPASWQHFRPIKYGAFHRISVAPTSRLSLALFEGIILAFQPEDERLGNYIRFLNPLLFYNAIDRESNSPGNVLIGADARWMAAPGASVYAQVILDDFEGRRIFSERDYWKNTWGFLLGLHLADVGLSGLQARAEYSRIRPYVYANLSGSLAYTHRSGFLGSPTGPNAELVSLTATYRPTRRLHASVSGFSQMRGRSADSLNYGENPFVPYVENRVSDRGISVLQGIRQARRFAEVRVGYEVLPAFWVDAAFQREIFDDALRGRDAATIFMLQLRWGMPADHPLY